MRYSAKDLITRSSRQLVYFSNIPPSVERKKKAPTDWMKEGSDFQDYIYSYYFPSWCREMRGVVEINGNDVFFSNDICVEDKFIEVKWLCEDSEVPKWYFERSLFQCAVYKALLKSCTTLNTATFARKSVKYNTLRVSNDVEYYLWFGADVYQVNITSSKPFIGFIEDKLDSLRNYNTATIFDNKYKFKEYESFKSYIRYSKLSNEELNILINK